MRTQYAHIIDMVPTALDLLGISPPAAIRGVAQAPLHGVSFAHTLEDPRAETRHHTQYFEMLGHRAIDHDGWRAVCPWPGPSFTEAGKGFGEPISADTLSTLDAEGWELYHVAEDPAETRNVAADNRDRLIAMIGTWYVEAGKYQVMPIDGSGLARMVGEKPLIALPRDRYTYLPNTQSVPNFAAPKVLNRPHSITADVEIPERGAEGVLLSQGTAAGGYTFFIKDGKLRYVHNYVGRQLLGVESEDDVPAGKHELRFEFEPTGPPDMPNGKGAPGRLQLYIDGTMVGDAEAALTTPFMFNPGALDMRSQPRLARHPRLRRAVHLHRDAPQRHPRRQRRADPRPRSRAPRPPGAAVAEGSLGWAPCRAQRTAHGRRGLYAAWSPSDPKRRLRTSPPEAAIRPSSQMNASCAGSTMHSVDRGRTSPARTAMATTSTWRTSSSAASCSPTNGDSARSRRISTKSSGSGSAPTGPGR